jgi:hypothetical protein
VPIKPVPIKEEVAFKWQAVAGAEVALYGASQSDDSARSVLLPARPSEYDLPDAEATSLSVVPCVLSAPGEKVKAHMHLLFAAGVAPQVVPEAGVATVKSPRSVWPMPALSEIATDWLLVTVSVLAGVVMLPQPSSQTLALLAVRS